MDFHVRIGEIILLDFPDNKYKKFSKKQGLIIGDTSIDEKGQGEYIVAYITTEKDVDALSDYAFTLDNENLEGGFIEDKSTIRLDKTISVHQNQIYRSNIAQLNPLTIEAVLRIWSRLFIRNFYKAVHKPIQNSVYTPGKSFIPYAGRVYDEKEMISLVDSSLDFWLTEGRYAERFKKDFQKFIGVQNCSLTNSGSSANLLAFIALTSPKLGDRSIKRGDEIITVAAGFPTTVSPIIQYGAIPIFVDVTFPTYNVDCKQLEAALSSKTKAVMLAHTMGNPFDIGSVKSFCDKHDLWLIEDCCDALGSKYTLDSSTRFVGTFGHLSTFSFFPAHHITMGEGGAVCTNDKNLKRLVESFRDWGRDCWCPPGKDNSCTKRFKQKFGELPYGYDHKYVYSHFGYNLKLTDMQAAIGCTQLEKLPDFIEARKRNWLYLYDGLANMNDRFILPEPTACSDPSWFGFMITVKNDVGLTRDQIVAQLEKNGIQTRMLFAGNLIKHPCFDAMRLSGQGYRIPNNIQLSNTDRIMRDTFWVGVYPGMSERMLRFILDTIKGFQEK